MMKIGTSGFRGVIGEEFNKNDVCKIIQATCKIINKYKFKRQVVVGYDNRFMSEIFAKWVAEVLCANDIEVLLTSSSVPSPLISFAGKHFDNDISIMITASHNPYYYNGIKIFSKYGQDLEAYLEKEFKKILPRTNKVKRVDFDDALSQGKIKKVDLTKEYAKCLEKLLKYKKDISIKTIFDVMHGSSFNQIKQLKQDLKLDVEIVNFDRDVSFGFDAPIPNQTKLEKLKKLAKENNVDFVFATDGDGDRLSVLDKYGNYYNGTEIACLLYYFAIKEKCFDGAFVKNYSFSLLADKICDYFGTDLITTKVGFKYIGDQLIKNNAILGAENSGCEINGGAFTKDGLAVYVLLLEVVNFYKKPLCKIIESMKAEVGYDMSYKEISFEVKNKKKVIDFFAKNKVKFSKEIISCGTLDGFKYFFDDGGWILIRFSGTENLIRLVCEQNSMQEVDSILQEVKNLVERI